MSIFNVDGSEQSMKQYMKAMRILCDDDRPTAEELERKERVEKANLLAELSCRVLHEIGLCLETLYSDSMSHLSDYAVIIKSAVSSDSFFSTVETVSICFLCLNATVAFKAFRLIHSVIVCSGTLSPLSALEAEIGIQFGITAETDHVVPSANMLVATVHGISNDRPALKCTYAQSSQFTFQDDLGRLISGVCRRLNGGGGGILCFIPSYRLLETLRIRWKATGVWTEFEQLRSLLLIEPRGDRQFASMLQKMKENYDFLLFAVFRGRASEGIDFPDDMARCVICVGLPYPNIKELTVDLKRKYNDQWSTQREHTNRAQLLSGNEWYEVQAFRALNQALGRCLRHKDDWGAILLIDERFTNSWLKYKNYFSSWIRNRVKAYGSRFDQLLDALGSFNECHRKQPVKSETIMCKSDAISSLFSAEPQLSTRKRRKPRNRKREQHLTKFEPQITNSQFQVSPFNDASSVTVEEQSLNVTVTKEKTFIESDEDDFVTK